jgi:dipeptidyl-peptidase 4
MCPDRYRYSYFADYFVQDLESGDLTPLVEDQAGDIQYAEFAPSGGTIAFVRGNNLYIYNDTEVTQITDDGGPDMFHAVPDWVYEEEIFGDRYTLWFSPDAQFMAFLSFNETGVGTFTIPYFMDSSEIAPQYPRELELRYPKVGTTNPTVQFNILDLSTMEYSTIPIDAFEPNNTVIGEVTWMTDDHSAVIYRVFNRVQDLSKHVLVDPVEKTATVVRDRDGTDGWLDNLLAMQYVGAIEESSNTTWYVDLSDESGWNHIYLCPVDSDDCTQLTDGEWEVVSVYKVDTSRGLIYYSSTEIHPTERHLYSVSFTGEKTALVDESVPAYWSASFSAGGEYFIKSYLGPDVPYQELFAINSTTEPLDVITSNEALYQNISEYNLPTTQYFELTHPDGYTLQVMERLPVDFDPSTPYPAIFIPYGGPGAQEVDKAMMPFNFRYWMSCDPELSFVSYTVDGRGTGYQGREFRSTVTSHLGRLEPLDQIWAAEQILASNRSSYLNADHVGMYGHSFGGYLTAKTLELQDPENGPFTFGIAGAPVSDWRFYDTLYTERYMKTLDENEEGYNETAVRNATGFALLKGSFAIAHGTGDDNVHYQNTAALMDLLVGSREVGADKLKMVAFTDSDHAVAYNGANIFLSKFYAEFLVEELARTDEELVHQWTRRGVEGVEDFVERLGKRAVAWFG